jgi:hypothetical protein
VNLKAGQGRDLGGDLDLRARCLELSKVTSRDGQPEVWLLRLKLFGAKTP